MLLIILLLGGVVNKGMRYFLKKLCTKPRPVCTNIRIVASVIDYSTHMVYKA